MFFLFLPVYNEPREKCHYDHVLFRYERTTSRHLRIFFSLDKKTENKMFRGSEIYKKKSGYTVLKMCFNISQCCVDFLEWVKLICIKYSQHVFLTKLRCSPNIYDLTNKRRTEFEIYQLITFSGVISSTFSVLLFKGNDSLNIN